jgi:hypothetical protein
MATTRILAAVTLIALVAAIIVLIVDPAFAQRVPGGGGGGTVRGAPGPIAGAGLITVVIGVGAYWLFRRFRKIS